MSSIERLIRRAGGPRAISTDFDVGAHDGADSLPLAERYTHIRFVAIEPTPDLAESLRSKSAHLANYTVVEAAVATEEGSRTLNAYAERPALNSLNRLDSSAAPVFGLQSPGPDSHQLVSAQRLSTICDELGIPTIDVIHVDTQGSDLDVLHSVDESRLHLCARALSRSATGFGYTTRARMEIKSASC